MKKPNRVEFLSIVVDDLRNRCDMVEVELGRRDRRISELMLDLQASRTAYNIKSHDFDKAIDYYDDKQEAFDAQLANYKGRVKNLEQKNKDLEYENVSITKYANQLHDAGMRILEINNNYREMPIHKFIWMRINQWLED